MKKQLKNNTIWLSFLSAIALIILFLIGTGTGGETGLGLDWIGLDQSSEYLDNGEYQRKTENEVTGDYNIWTGTKEVQGRWDGPVTIEVGMKNGSGGYNVYSTEKVTYVEGRRNGMSIIDYEDDDKPDSITCYTMGKRIPCQVSKSIQAVTASASQLLYYEYPWYVNSINAIGFDIR